MIRVNEHINGHWGRIRIEFVIEKEAIIHAIYELLDNKPSSTSGTVYKDQFMPKYKLTKNLIVKEIKDQIKVNGLGWAHPFILLEEPKENDEDNPDTLDWYKWQHATKIAYELFPEWFIRSNSVKFINDK